MIKKFEVGKVYRFRGSTDCYLAVALGPKQRRGWFRVWLMNMQIASYTSGGRVFDYQYNASYYDSWDEKE